jgi:hypothetical protein
MEDNMRTAVGVFSILLALGATILAPSVGAQPTQINSCQTISDPGSYALVDNLSTGGGDCLDITASFVTINLAGFTISGGGEIGSTGIKAAPTSGTLQGIAVRNGLITNFDTGVDLSSADGSIAEGLRVPGTGFVGIKVTNGIVKGNTVTGSFSAAAIAVLASVVTGNNASNTDSFGFDINRGIRNSGSTVIGNSATKGIIVTCPGNLIDNTAVGRPPNDNLVYFNAPSNLCHTANNVTP